VKHIQHSSLSNTTGVDLAVVAGWGVPYMVSSLLAGFLNNHRAGKCPPNNKSI
jgi:hypothetical protein